MADRNPAGRTLIMSGGSRCIGLATGIAVVGDVRRGVGEPRRRASRRPFRWHRLLRQQRFRDRTALDREPADQTVRPHDPNPVARQFLFTRACLPHLRGGTNPHVLSLSPPLNLSPKWLGARSACTLAGYGMTLLTLGLAAEYTEHGVAAKCLWPETLITTAAVQNVFGGDSAMAKARTQEIMADAAVAILSRPSPRAGAPARSSRLQLAATAKHSVSLSRYSEVMGSRERTKSQVTFYV
jgi:hypothetical protein